LIFLPAQLYFFAISLLPSYLFHCLPSFISFHFFAAQLPNGELTNLEYLPIKTENVEYLWNEGARTSCLFFPFKLHNNRFKQALDHEKWWRIEQPRVSTYQN
jgi:hypothetical protein